MTDLTTFLLTQIAAEEERAQAVIDSHEMWGWEAYVAQAGMYTEPAGEYATANDPAATLRRCAACRAIVAEHVAVDWGPGIAGEAVPPCRACNNQRHPCPTLRALASIYADHEDYDPAWRLG